MKIKTDYLLGILVAIPFAYPYSPFYPIAYLFFIFVLFKIKCDKECINDIIIIYLFILLIFIINIFNNNLNLSVLGTYITLLLLLSKFAISNINNFFRGILLMTTMYSTITLFLFFLLSPYLNGFEMFTNSSYRMWGEGYLLEWPNVFACFIIIGGFISFHYSNNFLLFLHIIASVLTTSRASLLFIMFILFILFVNSRYKKSYLIMIAVILSISILYLSQETVLFERIIKFSDRGIIYTILIEIFQNHIFGIGNVPFSELNPYYESYHSSFLKVLARYGLLGFALFIILLYPRNMQYKGIKLNLLIVFLLIGGLFQDFLFHPHVIIIYSVLVQYKGEKNRNVFF